jgi:hypothetical protein
MWRLVPVGLTDTAGVAVHGVDRRLEFVAARTVAAKALPHERLALLDQLAIPAGPVPLGERHQRRTVRGAGRAA